MSNNILVNADVLHRFVVQVFVAEGLPQDDATIVADNLTLANLRGVDTHGVFRVTNYASRIREGLINPRPQIRIEQTAMAAASVDGDNGMGCVVSTAAIQKAIEMASHTGIAMVSARHSNHFGMAAHYVLQAVEKGMVAMVMTNASPAFAPWGGCKALFGTSPLAIGVPAGQHFPFVLDMAMSVMARGNVLVAAQAGKQIPPGIGVDRNGQPTTDPNKVLDGGNMLPFGGVKGAALAMLMDILAGVFTGAEFAGRVGNLNQPDGRKQDTGHLFICWRPDLFMPLAQFNARMDELIKTIKSIPPATGFDEVLVPGERGFRCAETRRRDGIPLTPDVLRALHREASRLGLEHDLPQV